MGMLVGHFMNNIFNLFIRVQFFRFLIVGVLNTAFSYSAYVGLLYVDMDYRIASLLALVLGILFSFTTQGTVVFQNASWSTFFKFVIAWMVIYGFNILVITLLMRLSLSAYVAGAVATLPVTVVSFFVLKLVVFGHLKPEDLPRIES